MSVTPPPPKSEDAWMNFGALFVIFGALILVLGIFEYELILVSLFLDSAAQSLFGGVLLVVGIAVIVIRNMQGIPLSWVLRESARPGAKPKPEPLPASEVGDDRAT